MLKKAKSKAKIILKTIRNDFFTNDLHKLISLSDVNLDFFINRIIPLWQIASKVEGSVLECGVGLGRSAVLLEIIMSISNDKRNLYLLDSFEGFPELSPEDLKGPQKAKKGDWNFISTNDLLEILSSSSGLSKKLYLKKNTNRIHILKGFFENTITESFLKKIKDNGGISLLHLDVDLYESYKLTLNCFWDLVNRGGVIMFDEYHPSSLKKFPGSKKAIDEFLKSRNLEPAKIIKFDNSQICKRCYLIKP